MPTLEEIDAELDKLEEESASPEVTPTVDLPADIEPEVEEILEDADVEEPEAKTPEDKEPEVKLETTQLKEEPKEDKQTYAWKEMRETNKELQSKLDAFEELAKKVGYSSAKELLEKAKDEDLEKEAKEKDIDPTFYKDYTKTKEELTRVKQEKENLTRVSKIKSFSNALDTLALENGLTEDEKVNVLNELESDGYTIDSLIAIKTPKRLLTGYMLDKISAKKSQADLSVEKQALVEEKHNPDAQLTEDDLQKQLKEEMLAYKKSQGYL